MVHITKTSGLVQVCFPHKNTLWILINFTLFGPIGELKLSNRSRAAIPGVCDFEFAQQILRHIIFSQGIHYKTLVSCRSITWPILGTFFTAHFPLFGLKSIKKIYVFRKKKIYQNKFTKTYEHDNYCRIMLPQHPPKIFNCLIEWSLSCYVSITIPERKKSLNCCVWAVCHMLLRISNSQISISSSFWLVDTFVKIWY